MASTAISYKSSISLNVTSVDNQLTVFLNADVPDGGLVAKVYEHYVSGFAPSVNDTVDLTDAMNQMLNQKGVTSVMLTAVGSNYASGGAIAFEIKTDLSTSSVKESLDSYTSEQWSYTITKGE